MSMMTDAQYRALSSLAHATWGLQLTDGKRALVQSRLTKHVAQSPFETVSGYVAYMQGTPSNEELLELFDILSTNKTSFFREVEHYDYLRDHVYPALAAESGARPLQFWSAACSTGAEPYSLAMHALDHLPDSVTARLRILATDLSSTVLARARTAEYSRSELDGLSAARIGSFLEPVDADRYRIGGRARGMVSVHRLNLMAEWPMTGPFDVIMVRNVMIYFDRVTRERLVQRLCRLLSATGVLIVGSAETLSGLDVPLASDKPAIYRPMRVAA